MHHPNTIAHKTEVSGDVAGTWHLEPNHSPKAGETAQVWVALTQQGGRAIPLDQCDCRLRVYAGDTAEGTPVLEPPLEAIAAEIYQGIPGAEVIFPEVGEYQLQLTGSPKGEATFTPFELTYATVVAAGSAPAPETLTLETEALAETPAPETSISDETAAPAEPAALPDPEDAVSPLPLGALALILGGAILVIIAVARLMLRRRKVPNR